MIKTIKLVSTKRFNKLEKNLSIILIWYDLKYHRVIWNDIINHQIF